VLDQGVIDYLKSKKHLKSTRGRYPEIYVK